MVRRVPAKLRPFSRWGENSSGVSILVAFLIIGIAVGFLAWRSYELSVRMEEGATTLAVQYAGYAAEVTARRVDAAIRSELSRASEEWQQIERRAPEPDSALLRDWMARNEWIVSAVYIPDHDPASSIFLSEIGATDQNGSYLNDEFFTSTGTLRYRYDPVRLLAVARSAIQQQPLIRTGSPDSHVPVEPRAEVSVVRNTKAQGVVHLNDRLGFVSPLAPPLSSFAIRATVRTTYSASGWSNQRVMSLWLSFLALILLAAGAILAVSGLAKQAETMKLRADLIANVSHELRTPLAMIRLGAETLKLGAKLKAGERQEIEDTILREVLHLSHLVENVLDIARMQKRSTKALAFTPVQPRELISSVIGSYESWIRSKGFRVSIDCDEDIEAQLWDRDAVSRAVLNLIDNAIKYSADEKTIELSVRKTPADVVIAVRDHGIGIHPRDLTRIFDPYYRARFSDTQTRRGAGLGLTLVQQIVASHGGRVEVESQPGTGSTFRLIFPRPAADAEKAIGGVIQQSKPLPS